VISALAGRVYFPDYRHQKINRARVFGEDDLKRSGWPTLPFPPRAPPLGARGQKPWTIHQAQSDALATLRAFQRRRVAADLARSPGPGPLEIGRGRGWGQNGTLINQRLPPPLPGPSGCGHWADLGIGETDREALAFALLAWWHQHGDTRIALPSVIPWSRAGSSSRGLRSLPGAASSGWGG